MVKLPTQAKGKQERQVEETVASTILGSIDFVDKIKDRYLNGKKVDRNQPALAELTTRQSLSILPLP